MGGLMVADGIICPLRFEELEGRMRLKDASLAAALGALTWASGIRKWREKYPEDFADLKGSDPYYYLHTKAAEYIVLQATG
jgi:hypothetical protein